MSDLTFSIDQATHAPGTPPSLVLRLVGSVSIDDAAQLERAVAQVLGQAPLRVVVDISKLSFISSVGMAALVKLHRGLKHRGGEVRLVGPSPPVFGVLDRARLIELMPIAPSVESALL
ncbi:MAG: STAS domain-containing protein [Planctomycetota bacterium]|nr:STAS domain-containing protein [Planctomycetota bacterium]